MIVTWQQLLTISFTIALNNKPAIDIPICNYTLKEFMSTLVSTMQTVVDEEIGNCTIIYVNERLHFTKNVNDAITITLSDKLALFVTQAYV